MFLVFFNNFCIIFGNFGLIPKSVSVINPKQRTGKRRHIAESDQQALVNLALRSDKRPAEQEH